MTKISMVNTMGGYNFKTVEENWRDKWFNDNLYAAEDFSPKTKKYILAEFPYPSGSSLHAGHMMRYTVPDVYSRYLRMRGYNVLFPMGWDAFGLPAELYAIKTGIHPAVSTKNTLSTFKESFKIMGFGIDWNREINTTDPNYYKWTQWIFLKFFKEGLAEYNEMPVWWCPELGVLADEEVLTDKEGNKISERGSYKVERKFKRQWVLKIPEYAEKLLQGLEKVDYPESIKNAQINWIGKSVGAEINFKIKDSSDLVTVFTTRLDTIYGATFIVLSPEHPLAESIATSENIEQVKEYIKKAGQKSEMERTELLKEKTGVFTGSYAINPYNNEEVPIWIGEFVVMSYGTGAIMGVPAHDERDHEFALKYDLPVIQVVTLEKQTVEIPYTDYGVLINSEQYSGLTSNEATKIMLDEAEKNKFGKSKTNYKIRDWIFSRQRYWGEPIPLLHRQDGKVEPIADPDKPDEVKEKLPLIQPEVPDFHPLPDGTSPIAKNEEWVSTLDSEGNPAKREVDTMPNWAGSSWYYLRYTDPDNNDQFADSKKMEYWLPVDKYFGGSEHTTLHLLYSRFWHRFLHDQGLVPCEEPYNWRLNGGILLGEDGRKMSKSLGNVVDPMTVVENYGADALRLFICFLGPYTDTYPWNQNGIKACWRLLKNIYDNKEKVVETEENMALEKAYNRMVKNITDMSEGLKMNTAVSELMIFTNELKKVEKIDVLIWKGFIKVLAPYAPFLAEELWQEINKYSEWKKENSVHLQDWPVYDPALAEIKNETIPVQINGKVRGEVEIGENDTEDTLRQKVMENPKLSQNIQGKELQKFIYIPGKIINLVVK
jgi:leucyl-tRNA synthetase